MTEKRTKYLSQGLVLKNLIFESSCSMLRHFVDQWQKFASKQRENEQIPTKRAVSGHLH